MKDDKLYKLRESWKEVPSRRSLKIIRENTNLQAVSLEEDDLVESINDKNIFKAVIMVGGPGCFDQDSEVETKKGKVKIKDINIDDEVYTLTENGEKQLNPVESVFIYDSPHTMIEIGLDNGHSIICTADHKIRLKDGSFKEAGKLTEDDELEEM